MQTRKLDKIQTNEFELLSKALKKVIKSNCEGEREREKKICKNFGKLAIHFKYLIRTDVAGERMTQASERYLTRDAISIRE